MRTKRRRSSPHQPDLFSVLETPRQKSDRISATGNYSTRTVRKWIRSDPCTQTAATELADGARRLPVVEYATRTQAQALRVAMLTMQLIGWFQQAVSEEEPSTNYVKFLHDTTDVEWGILAEELYLGDWGS